LGEERHERAAESSLVEIIPSIKTDHSAIFLELEEIESTGRGAGFWKLNSSLFMILDAKWKCVGKYNSLIT